MVIVTNEYGQKTRISKTELRTISRISNDLGLYKHDYPKIYRLKKYQIIILNGIKYEGE